MPDQVPEGSVVITPSEMFTELRAVHDEVKHLSAVVDPALAEIRADVADNKADIREHGHRFRQVEARLWFAAGVATALGTFGGALVTYLSGI